MQAFFDEVNEPNVEDWDRALTLVRARPPKDIFSGAVPPTSLHVELIVPERANAKMNALDEFAEVT